MGLFNGLASGHQFILKKLKQMNESNVLRARGENFYLLGKM